MMVLVKITLIVIILVAVVVILAPYEEDQGCLASFITARATIKL